MQTSMIIENLKTLKYFSKKFENAEETLDEAVAAVEEVERYKQIGTVEECMEMKKISEKATKEEMQKEIYILAAKKIKQYYETGEPAEVGQAIEKIYEENEKAIIIEKYYKEEKTIEQIARELRYDYSLIVRAKKKLCIEVYWQLQKGR